MRKSEGSAGTEEKRKELEADTTEKSKVNMVN